jgi:hypothetical protein
MRAKKRLAVVAACLFAAPLCALGARAISGNVDPPFGVSPVATTFTGTHTSMTSALATFDQPFRLLATGGCDPSSACGGSNAVIRRLDQMKLTCHGGTADIRWEIGDLESTVSQTGITLSLVLDGRPLASLLKGGFNGTYDDGPATLEADARCAKGPHSLWVEIDHLDGEWGVPYADRGEHIVRGFVVTETW